MKNISFKLSTLIFLMAFLSGFYWRLPLLDNLIRSLIIYSIFSVILLVIVIVLNQDDDYILKSNREIKNHSGHEDFAGDSSPKRAK